MFTHLGQRAILRHKLDAIEKRFPLSKPMVVESTHGKGDNFVLDL